MLIFKYVSPSVLGRIFEKRDSVGFKFSYLSDYNDPYEFFLTINDPKNDPKIAACFLDLMRQVTGFPATCFSLKPDIIPMWAHYANNSSGFVIVLDDEVLSNSIPQCVIDNVRYEDACVPLNLELVQRAAFICKPRYSMMLSRSMFARGYFYKHSYWSYECERRVVLLGNYKELLNDNMVVNVGADSVGAIICGPRASDEDVDNCRAICSDCGFGFYRMVVGRNSMKPYFITDDSEPLIFDGTGFVTPDNWCEECLEPMDGDISKCAWCTLTEDDVEYASSRNPLNMLARYGLLEEYVAATNKI